MMDVAPTELDLPGLHARALERTRRVIAGIGADQWAISVETAGTTVRGLVNHVVGGNLEVESIIAGLPLQEVRPRFRGDMLGDDPLAAYDGSVERAKAAFADPEAMSSDCDMDASGSPRPGSDYCGNRFVDVLVHGWEIAKVTGLDTRLDPDLAEPACMIIEPEIRTLREKGIIREPLDVPARIDPQTRLLALFGFSD